MKITMKIGFFFIIAGWMTLLSQPIDQQNALAGVKKKADIDAIVAKLQQGELTGAQSLFSEEGSPYRVYTSYINNRRGAADLHVLDHEVFLVLSGDAEVTLGGEISDKKNKTEYEIRGTTIVGGTTSRVAAGDIISIPSGTPHQMNPGTGHILYLVIKIFGPRKD